MYNNSGNGSNSGNEGKDRNLLKLIHCAVTLMYYNNTFIDVFNNVDDDITLATNDSACTGGIIVMYCDSYYTL